MNNYNFIRRTINFNRFPNFLIIGANKGGTTSIHNWCSQHPEILMSKLKEPMFFTAPSRNKVNPNATGALGEPKFICDLDAYQNLFKGGSTYKARGEASTSYLVAPRKAIPKIKAFKPDMKIIASLREPLDRTISAFNMYSGSGIEKRTFEKAIKDEISAMGSGTYGHMPYLQMSKYFYSIKMYIEAFGAENVLIQKFEKIKTNPDAMLKGIFTFLDVNPIADIKLKKLNSSDKWLDDTKKLRKENLSDELIQMCNNVLAEDVMNLNKLMSNVYNKGPLFI